MLVSWHQSIVLGKAHMRHQGHIAQESDSSAEEGLFSKVCQGWASVKGSRALVG